MLLMLSAQWPPDATIVVWGIVVLLTLLLAIVWVYAAIRVWLGRKEFTRERFAFYALRAHAVGLALLAEAVAGEGVVVHLGIQLLNELVGTHLTPPATTYFPGVLLLFGLVAGIWFSKNVFRDWDGRWSVAAQTSGGPPKPGLGEIVREANRYVRVEQSRKPAREPAPRYQVKLEGLARRLWSERARELWELKTSCFSFGSYHDRDRFWTGTTDDRNTTFYLLCVTDAPDDAQLRDFIKRAKTHAGPLKVPQKRREYFVAVERGRPYDRTRTVDDQRIEQASEEQLLDNLVDFRAYREEIDERVAQQQPPNGWMLLKSYVAAHVDGGKPLDALIRSWLGAPTEQQLALLGDYGSGKTSAVLMLCHGLLRDLKPPRIPILIEMRGKSPRTLRPNELLTLWCGRYGIRPRALKLLHESERLLLIFEGIDEVDLIGDQNIRRDHMQALWTYAYADVQTKLLFTTRPNFAFGTAELIAELGGARHCTALRLDPFTLDDMDAALFMSEHRDSILASARSNELFLRLISRPFMLHVVSHVWARLQGMPSVDGAAAMELYVDEFYDREAKREADGPLTAFRLTTAERRYFMRAIATHMTLNAASTTNSITRAQYDQLMDDLILRLPESLKQDTAACVRYGEPGEPLRRRMPAGTIGQGTIKQLVQTRGLLVNDSTDGDRIKFAHKAFLEFLAADARARFVHVSDGRNPVDELPFVTSNVILDDTSDSRVVQWFAEILRGRVARPGQSDVETCQRLYRTLVHPGGGILVSPRAGLNWVAMRLGATFWVITVVVALVAMFVVWGLILDLNRFRGGVNPRELIAIVGGILLLVLTFSPWMRLDRRWPSRYHRIVVLGSLVLGAAAFAMTRWQFAAVTFVMLLPLLNYSSALPWMRVWARCCGHLGYDDAIKRAALGVSTLPWWARDVQRDVQRPAQLV